MKYCLLYLTIICTTLSAGELRYSLQPDRQIVNVDRELFGETSQILQQPGKPSLPYTSLHFVLPYGETIDRIDIEALQLETIDDDIDLPCAQQPRVIGRMAQITPRDEDVYGSDALFPAHDWELVAVQRLSGVDIAIINVFPYKYNPVRSELSCYRSVDITIKTLPNEAVGEQQAAMICKSQEAQRRWAALTVNVEITSTYPECNFASRQSDLIDPEDPSTLVIVAGESYLDLFHTYAAWKESHGVTTAVYTIEDILIDYTTGVDDPANLRDFIIDAFQTWASSDYPLEYVLLAGDDEIIPIRGVWGYIEPFGPDYNIPCDLYYGALDGDWNANGNAYYGEEDDDPDLYPEVHVGRFPGDNVQDFENMIFKIQEYVENPWPDLHSALMVGELLYADPLLWGSDFLDLICEDSTYMPPYYNVTKMYQREGTFSTGAVTQHVNSNGSAMIYHCAHTNYNYLLGWSPSDVDNLQNTRYPFFSSGGCHTLAFDQGTSGNLESVGEHALTADNAMMAYLGHSRYGISVWTYFIQEIMRGIFALQLGSIGSAFTHSRDQLAQYVPTHEMWRWEFYELIYMGDPEIHLLNAGPCTDVDSDGHCDSSDNCHSAFNPGQADVDYDEIGDVCDNCVNVYNPDQIDLDDDGSGDACDPICCGLRGDIDHNGSGPDVADLVFLVNFMFSGGTEPPCIAQSDVDGNATGPDIADLVYLVNYMFNGGPAPVPCT